MKNIINVISITAFILFIAWFISEPDYEPGIGILLSITSLISIFYLDKKNQLKKLIYKITVRGMEGEDKLKVLIKSITDEFFEISKYRYNTVDYERYEIIFEANEKISHKDLFEFVRNQKSEDFWKIYEVTGEGQTYDLTDVECLNRHN